MSKPNNQMMDPELAKSILGAYANTNKNRSDYSHSRDFSATLKDDEMKVAMARSWEAWEQFLLTQQRESALVAENEFQKEEYCNLLVVMNRIMNAALVQVEQGREIIANREQIK